MRIKTTGISIYSVRMTAGGLAPGERTLQSRTQPRPRSEKASVETAPLSAGRNSGLQGCWSRALRTRVLGPALSSSYQFILASVSDSYNEENSSRGASQGGRGTAGLQVSQHSLLLFIFCNAYKGTEARVIKYLQSPPNPQESCS